MLGCTQIASGFENCGGFECTKVSDDAPAQDTNDESLGVTCKKCGAFLLIADEEALIEHGATCKYVLPANPPPQGQLAEEVELDRQIEKLTASANISIKMPPSERLNTQQLKEAIQMLKKAMRLTRTAEKSLRQLSRKIANKTWSPEKNGKRRKPVVAPTCSFSRERDGVGSPTARILQDTPLQMCDIGAELPLYKTPRPELRLSKKKKKKRGSPSMKELHRRKKFIEQAKRRLRLRAVDTTIRRKVYEASTCLVTQAVGKKVGIDLYGIYLRLPSPMAQGENLWESRIAGKTRPI